MLAILDNMFEEIKAKPQWARENVTALKILDAAPSSANDKADDADFAQLQECHDSVTRLTLAIKRLAPEVVKIGKDAGSFVEEQAAKALSLLRELTKPANEVEECLFQIPSRLLKSKAMRAVDRTKEPYNNLVEYYKSMASTYSRLNKEHGEKPVVKILNSKSL